MNIMKRLMLEQVGTTTALAGSFNGGTGISIKVPDFNFGDSKSSGSSQNSPTTTSKGGGFFGGFNLNGLLDTLLKGGMTWAQIEAAKNGKDVYVQGAGGEKENITPMLISKLNEQAKVYQKSQSEILKMMQLQMTQNANNPKPPKEDKTLLYVGIGVGALVLIGGGILLINNNKKKNK
ncbi:hypothetical protein V2647_06830 [Tenacibaculum maritimum]|uniref:hypothetical protein n=1 Tax=Tenacibaculum maritimum TaxID=107401 RepID=UPI0038761611